jgi:hypothetical protein
MTKIDVTNVLDQRLTVGNDDGTGTQPCVMNAVHARWLLARGVFETGALTDLPECTDILVARIAQVVNDRLAQQGRDLSPLESEELQVRLMLAHAPADPMVAKRVRVRTLIWAAESVAHLVDEADREKVEGWVAIAQRWVDGTATEEDATAASAAAATAYAATAYAATAYAATASAAAAIAYAATAYAAGVAATAYAAAAVAAAIAYAEMDLVEWLDDLLTAHEKARAVEGVLHETVA